MLSSRDKIKVSGYLDTVLGGGSLLKNDEHAHYCPFCSHHKKKLQVNIESQKWHCWVCNAKGKKIYTLFKKLNTDISILNDIKKIYGTDYVYVDKKEENEVKLQLPVEFKSLAVTKIGFNPMLRNVLHYAKKRGITDEDIIRYNIGYCETGRYKGRIIVPSYDKNYDLNYFIARTIFEDEEYPYTNPPVSKNIIALESQVNWREPIKLCEGIFDAVSIKRNVIPLFGKFISDNLMKAIFENGVKEIFIMLDIDAQEQALYYTDYFNRQGIKTTNIVPQMKDPNKLGFSRVNYILKNTHETTFEDIITQKLNLL